MGIAHLDIHVMLLLLLMNLWRRWGCGIAAINAVHIKKTLT